MGNFNKIVKVSSIVLLLILIFGVIRYLILIYDPFCFKNFDCDPDWEPSEYYKDGIADSLIEECARYGADNLEFSQFCNGKYRYIYDAAKDEYELNGYSIVRHAGTTYAILDLYKEIKVERYLKVGTAGLDYLISFNQILTWDSWAINYNFDMSVGAVALTILGMVRYYEATEDSRYNIYIEKYANFIVSQQRDDGAYAARFGSLAESEYYSAEAFFALALAYDVLEIEEYKKSMKRALKFYWTDDYEYNNSAFIPWASSGCAKWYEMTENSDFLDFCFEMTDIQIARQNLVNTTDKFGNSLYGYIKYYTVNTGVYLEGIGDALRVAKSEEDTIRISNYHSCLKAGVEWVSSLQFRDESQLACPNRGYGGFHRGFDVEEANIIRIDYTQHAISAILRVLREFNKSEIDAIKIREGMVDFKPKESNQSLIVWWIYPIIFGLIVIPSIYAFNLIQNFLKYKRKRDKKKIISQTKKEY